MSKSLPDAAGWAAASAGYGRQGASSTRQGFLRVPLALALLSAGGLLFEIALTRLLSFLYFSSFTYLVLSLAVLGLAGGAALAALRPALRSPRSWGRWAALASLASLAVALIATSGFAPAQGAFLIPLAAVPYLFLGLAVAGIFAERSFDSPRLYLTDLAGAGVGALLAAPVIDLLGGSGGLLAAALLPALAGLLLAPRQPWSLAALLACSGLLTLHASGPALQVNPAALPSQKPLRSALTAGAEPVASNWDSLARSDLVHYPELDRYEIYIDGAAGSLVPDRTDPASWQGDIGALAFEVEGANEAFLIGPGGGLDIALARRHGVQRVEAAEVNRAAVELTRELAVIAGDLYGEGTLLTIDDGRRALQRSGGTYDLILLSQVVTMAAEARGLALVENGLYTVEAFSDYLDQLAPGGRFAVKLYDELTLTRALLTALTALMERGVPQREAARHLFAALDTRASPPVPLLIVSAVPLGARAIDWARRAEELGFALLYVPGLIAPPALAAIEDGRSDADSLIAEADEVDLRPSRDDRPYFYQFERGLPRALRPLVFAVGTLLLAALAASLWRSRKEGAERRLAPLLFASLGMGFMLFEIALLQRTQLAIGHPTLALSAVLSALLLGAAVGSGMAGRTRIGVEYRRAAQAALAAALLGLLWLFTWPAVVPTVAGRSASESALWSAFAVLPLAAALGTPFPLALRAIGRRGAGEVALAWAVNGLASVAGAVAATALAIAFGLTVALLAAVATYLVAAVLALAAGRHG